MSVASVLGKGEVVAHPRWLYNLYKALYRNLDTGARPLLELAKQTEAEGDIWTASTLRKLYTLLQVSKGIIEEIEQEDYRQRRREVEEGISERIDSAVKLLIEAKKAALEGDMEKLNRLLDEVVLEVEGRRATLGGVIDILTFKTSKESEEAGNLLWMLHEYLGSLSPEGILTLNDLLDRVETWLKDIDIYGAIIKMAESLDLEVRVH